MGFAHPRDLLAMWSPRSRHDSLWRYCPLLPTPFGSLDSAGRMESCGRLPCDSMTCLSIMMYHLLLFNGSCFDSTYPS